jgi:hypothetical protein
MRMFLGPKWNPPSVDSNQMSKYPIGTKENPIRTQGITGERYYLNKLKCQNGDHPQYARAGSVGVGPYGYILDLYIIKCGQSNDETQVYMDLYHPKYVENKPVNGFTLE